MGDGALGVAAVRPVGGARPSLEAFVAGMSDIGRVSGRTSPFLQSDINFIAYYGKVKRAGAVQYVCVCV